MAARIPRSIRIGPHVYRVRTDERAVTAEAKRQRADPADFDAFTVFNTRTIVMRRGVDRPRTLLHEVLHAALDLAGVGAGGALTGESAVASLDGVLLGVIRDNPALMAYLAAEEA